VSNPFVIYNMIKENSELLKDLCNNQDFIKSVSNRLRMSVLKNSFLHDVGDRVIRIKKPDIEFQVNQEIKNRFDNIELEKRLNNVERELKAFKEGWKEFIG